MHQERAADPGATNQRVVDLLASYVGNSLLGAAKLSYRRDVNVAIMGESAMLRKIGASTTLLCLILLASASSGNAEDAAARDPTSWPIRHWRNHQPLRSDITPKQSRNIQRLYMQLEQNNPKLVAPLYSKIPPRITKSGGN
jgi:hypothetical protein